MEGWIGGRRRSALERVTWQDRAHVLAHILTSPSTAPSLHSQLFVASLVPCYLAWDYPPFRCDPPPLLRWSLSLFLRRAPRYGLPLTSWRSYCPFQQPPPLVLAPAAEPPPERWGPEERRAWVRRRRMRRGSPGVKVPAFVAVAAPNLLLLSLLLWDPLSPCSRP